MGELFDVMDVDLWSEERRGEETDGEGEDEGAGELGLPPVVLRRVGPVGVELRAAADEG